MQSYKAMQSYSSKIDTLFSSTTTQQSQLDNIANSAIMRGTYAFTQGNYGGAITAFKMAIGLSPYGDNTLSAYQLMANAYQQQGKTGDAIKSYQQASKLFPQSDIPYASLGDIYYGQKNYTAAEGQYAMAVKLNPTLASNVYSLGQAYMAEGKYTAAETQFKKVTQLSPTDPSGYYALGQDYHKMRRYDDAITQLNKAIQLNRSFPAAHLELGMTYADMNQMDKANEQANLLGNMDQTSQTTLQNYIYQAASPKFLGVYTTSSFVAFDGPGTALSTMDSSLASPNSSQTYAMNFIFSKSMDASSVQNLSNWNIGRSTGKEQGGSYNWGLPVKSNDTNISPLPVSVIYNPNTLTANVSFKITQNSSGNGIMDPSHVMFKFAGMDAYGKSMDNSADQYSGISQIV